MKRLLMLAGLLALAVALHAEDRQWVLSDGRTVTVIKVISQNATHVTVRCPEGLLQIDKRKLPEALQAEYPYDAQAAAAQQQQAEESAKSAAAPAVARSVAPRPAAPAEGDLSILDIRPAGRGMAFVTIANHTTSMAEITREMLVGVTVNGTPLPVLRFTDDHGSIFKLVRVLPRGKREVCVVLDVPEGEVGDVRGVYWRQAK